MDSKHISVRELATEIDVGTNIIELFSNSLFKCIPAEGFTASQAEMIRNKILHPFSEKVIEETADKWIRKNL